MSDKTKVVVDKMIEYGMIIFRDYPIEEKDVRQHVFICEDMVLFLDHNDVSLSVSFHASLKPEEVARNALILNEIEDFDQLFIMESYIINNDNELICGDEAFKLWRESEEAKYLRGFLKNRQYEEILRTSKCFIC